MPLEVVLVVGHLELAVLEVDVRPLRVYSDGLCSTQ